MIEIKKIYKKEVDKLLNDTQFWNHSFLSISKHRLYAHSKNPNIDDNDIVLILGYLNSELVGYMGVFIDKITINKNVEKIGWLSTWWVHPKTKGSGIGREILNTMYAENIGRIGISQFTESAKRVYDKSGFFYTLKNNQGLKAVLRSNLTFVLPKILPISSKISFVFKFTDDFLNVFINLKLKIQQVFLLNNLENVTIEYLNFIDNETFEVINKYNKKDISFKSKEFFEWLKSYNWVQKAPSIDLTNALKYEFSMYANEFEYSFLKINENNVCVGFVVLQKRDFVMKVLFTYFDSQNQKTAKLISDVIKIQAIRNNIREIICYEETICESFKKSSIFLYQRKKIKQSIISKVFGVNNFDNYRVNFGDGDCAFA